MGATEVATGEATAARKRPPNLAPEWEERLERVCRLTVRTSLILELCGLDKSARHRIKDLIDRCYDDFGSATPSRPRGQAASYGSGNFLETVAERYDAAYLLALHHPHGSGEFSESETSLGRALDKRIETYLQYLTHLYPGKAMGRVSFETYCEMLKGMRCGGIEVQTCKQCGTRHPVQVTRLGQSVCPVCYLLRPKVSAFRVDLEARIRQLRAERLSGELRSASA